MGSERVHGDDLDLAGVTWHRAWRSARATVRLGETGDRRWVAEHSGRGAFANWSERGACDRLDRWLARGAWRELAVAVE
jgi:hypothetical protein